jgi:hypothetical protein
MLEYNFLYPIRKQLKNITCDFIGGDTDTQYKENLKNPQYKDLIPTEYFNYKYNNYGFRCDDFTDYNQHKYRILFLGCSDTEGLGLPLKESWAYKLLHRINEDFNQKIPYWNISMAGSGLDQQVRALYQLNDILKPHIIIALFPDSSRREIYNGLYYFKNIKTPNKKKEYDNVFFDNRLILYQLGKNLSFLKLLAEKNNTKIIANAMCSIDHYYEEYFKHYDFYRYETDYYSCKIDYSRDLRHLGKKSNTKFALKVYDEIFPIVKQILQ